MVRRINFFGGPGVGKSTMAAWAFAQLKGVGVNDVELVSEWIKGWAWDRQVPRSYDQLYVFAKQLRMEDRVLRHGACIVSDSPLMLQLAYVRKYSPWMYTSLMQICQLFDQRYPALNFYVEREVEYKQAGRYENEAQAIDMDNEILGILNAECHGFLKIKPATGPGNLIFKQITDALGVKNG